MFMLLFYVLLAIYLIVRGGREAGFWSTPSMLEGILMLGAGAFLLLANVA